jgi:hypothetical protein
MVQHFAECTYSSFLAVSVNFNWLYIGLNLDGGDLEVLLQCMKDALHNKCWVLDCVLIACECVTGLPSGTFAVRHP